MVRGERQKELVKTFSALCDRHNRWQVWSDFISMSAIAISNTVDLAHAEEREKTYMTLAKRYNSAEMNVFSDMLAQMIVAIDVNPDQDFLGDLFMNLELSNDHAGQFFTPYHVCKLMAKITEPDIKGRVERDGFISVNDCACGAGALLVAFANECLAQKVNYQTDVLFTAQDIDYTVGLMCYLQLSLIGAPGYVKIGNSITEPLTSHDRKCLLPVDNGTIWYTPMFFRDVWYHRRQWAMLDIAINQMAALGAAERPTEAVTEPSPLELPAPPEITENPEETPMPVYAETATGQLTFF